MGLRCLIGHEYGDAMTERDRRQRGSEVVVTVREFRECTRCGHRRIISENKEVTTDPVEGSAAESGTDPPIEASWSPDEADQESGEPAGSVTATMSDAGGGHEESMTAEEDDGIILDDEPDQPRRGHGEWPDAEVEGDDAGLEEEHAPWPDEADGDPADVAKPTPPSEEEPPADEAVPVGDERESAADAAAADPDASAEVIDADEASDGPDEQTPDPASSGPDAPTPRPDPTDVELVCPECSETWPSVNISLRPGDICPDCRAGYLDEKVIQ